MIVLAVDPGTRCGFAIGGVGGISGTWDLAPKRGDSPGMRYIYLRTKLEWVLNAYSNLELVAYEMAHHRGGAATEYAIGVVTHLQSWCAERNIEHVAVHAAQVKRHATGRGNAKKPEMLAAAEKRFGFRPQFDDEADALWILDYAMNAIAKSGQ